MGKHAYFEIALFLIFFAFANLLMWGTFTLSPESDLQIASKVWSDFAATIPLIRSFSLGDNFPPQYPIFAGPNIRYHFAFYWAVGMLERVGLPLDFALNLPSSFFFALFLLSTYLLAKTVFKSVGIALSSTLLSLFNGSFSFLEFFKNFPLSIKTPQEVFLNSTFASFGPYDGKLVSAFWSLNIFTNQRHLSLGYFSFIFLILIIYLAFKNQIKLTPQRAILLGGVIGLFPFIHQVAFGAMGIVLILSFILFRTLRLKVLITGLTALLVAIPQIHFMGKSQVVFEPIRLGYLIDSPTLAEFISYWFLNLGLVSVAALLGFFFSNKDQKKMFILFFSLFAIGNVFQFSPEIAANHKFFNLALVGFNMFAAFFMARLWQKKIIGKIITVLIFPFFILSGILDLFPILNDRKITIEDIPNNETATFILKNTPRNAVFLNGSYLYDPASLAGRKIFMGWPYFSWSAGYDTHTRLKVMQNLLNPGDKESFCRELRNWGIDFIEIVDPTPIEDVEVNYQFFKENLTPIFSGTGGDLIIYDPNNLCLNTHTFGNSKLS